MKDDDKITRLIRSLIENQMHIKGSELDLIRIPSGEEAIRLLEMQLDDRVDGLMVDRYNPNDDGLQIIQMYHTRYPDAEIALYTEEGNKDYHNNAVVCGASTLIQKPVSFHGLKPFFLKVLRKKATGKPSIIPLTV